MNRKLLVLALALASAAARAEDRPVLAVFDLASRGASSLEAEASSAGVARGIRELDAFEVLSSEDIRQMLSIERQKQLLGGGDDASMAASLTALGARHQLVGSVTRTGAGLTAELRLLDTQGGAVLGQAQAGPFATLDRLLAALAGTAQEAVGPLLRDQLGTLVVRTAEEGAEIVLDDVVRGTTPSLGGLTLPMGRHRLAVKKDGFVAHSSTVVVKKGQVEVREVVLVPSADYARAWAARNQKMRVGAWLTTGLAVASLAAALIVDRAVAEPRYQSAFVPRQRALEQAGRGALAADDPRASPTEAACAGDPVTCRQELQKLQAELQGLQAASWVMVGVGVVSAGFATYFWVAGDNPNRYLQLVGGAGPGGASVGLRGAF